MIAETVMAAAKAVKATLSDAATKIRLPCYNYREPFLSMAENASNENPLCQVFPRNKDATAKYQKKTCEVAFQVTKKNNPKAKCTGTTKTAMTVTLNMNDL